MTEFETTPEHMLRHNVNDPETDFLNGKSLSVQIPGRLFVVVLISIVSIFNSKKTDELSVRDDLNWKEKSRWKRRRRRPPDRVRLFPSVNRRGNVFGKIG
jgi:hypothetical protein